MRLKQHPTAVCEQAGARLLWLFMVLPYATDALIC